MTDTAMLYVLINKFYKGGNLMKFYVGGIKTVSKNNNSILGWSAVCKDGILVENSHVNGTDIK